MHNILALTDRAVIAYLLSNGVGSTDSVYPYKRSGGKATPCVIVASTRGVPVAPFDATCVVDCAVMSRTAAPVDEPEAESDPIDANDALVSAVSTALHRFGDGAQSGNDLAEAITDAANAEGIGFVCHDVEISSIETEFDRNGDTWTDTIHLRLTASPRSPS